MSREQEIEEVITIIRSMEDLSSRCSDKVLSKLLIMASKMVAIGKNYVDVNPTVDADKFCHDIHATTRFILPLVSLISLKEQTSAYDKANPKPVAKTRITASKLSSSLQDITL